MKNSDGDKLENNEEDINEGQNKVRAISLKLSHRF